MRATLAALPGTGLFAVGTTATGAVAVHRAGVRAPIAELETVMDLGGHRLALGGDEAEPVVVAGAWERHGVVGSSLDGSQVWQRADLKRPQVLTAALGGRLVAVHCDRRPLHLLDVRTGATVASVRDVQAYADHPRPRRAVGGRFGRALGLDTTTWRPTWRTVLGHGESPEWRTAAVSPTHVVVTAGDHPRPDADVPLEVPPPHGGHLWCLDVEDGSLAWRVEAPEGWGVRALAFDGHRDRWLVVERSFDRPVRAQIAEHDRTGARLGAEEVDLVPVGTLALGGLMFATAHGEIAPLDVGPSGTGLDPRH